MNKMPGTEMLAILCNKKRGIRTPTENDEWKSRKVIPKAWEDVYYVNTQQPKENSGIWTDFFTEQQIHISQTYKAHSQNCTCKSDNYNLKRKIKGNRFIINILKLVNINKEDSCNIFRH